MEEYSWNLERLCKELGGPFARDFFHFARASYLGAPLENLALRSCLETVGQGLSLKPEELWVSPIFHLLFRATKPAHLGLLGLEQGMDEAETAVNAGRVMSILPYNLVMADTTVRKYIPSRSDKFSGNWRYSMDPYGIFSGQEQVVAVDKSGNRTYLGSRKFSYAVLANITESCIVGCDGCYKGSMVRTALSTLAELFPQFAQIKKQLTLQEERAESQARLLTKWLNLNPEVDTVVISGGEPTLFSNNALGKILAQFKQAANIRVVRMCTSSIFQGMWYRIDDGLAGMLMDFEKETGKRFYINAHVTDDFQLGAPEAAKAVEKLRRAGISIHLQMPVQEGINFRREDLDWSVQKLKTVSRLAYHLGVIPYKMIVDMHSPSHPDITVPIEIITRAISFLDQHESHSDHQRWQAYNVLHSQGNIYLNPYPYFTAVKDIDLESQKVTYFIPKVEFGENKRVVVHTYQEPLIPGHNDDPASLSEIPDYEIKEKIARVRALYQKLNEGPEAARAFYLESGINFPENKPLLI